MKQKHINLLRAAANTLQSSMIQDENIIELKKEHTKALAENNMKKCQAIKGMIAFARNRNKSFLQEYADIIQQLCEQPFTALIDEVQESKEINPLFANILAAHFPENPITERLTAKAEMPY